MPSLKITRTSIKMTNTRLKTTKTSLKTIMTSLNTATTSLNTTTSLKTPKTRLKTGLSSSLVDKKNSQDKCQDKSQIQAMFRVSWVKPHVLHKQTQIISQALPGRLTIRITLRVKTLFSNPVLTWFIQSEDLVVRYSRRVAMWLVS